ncbi:MAG: hypothetical protein WA865_23255 [Spirulinaceae cyanobacterium]
MSQEVVQWLEEIRVLRQQLAEAETFKDEANQGSANWRKLYSQEAQQRRMEAKLAQQTIKELQAEIRHTKAGRAFKPDSPEAAAAIEEEVAELTSFKELRARLTEAIKERDGLTEALKLEKEEHEKTRKSLTAVIGDTIDQLAKSKKESRD